jgi:hypothetical protein
MNMRLQFILLIFLFSSTNACNQKAKNEDNACIKFIMEKDELLGKVRNQYSKQHNLSTTIYYYTEGLRALDYQQCPEAFRSAFMAHIEAWDDMLRVTDKYPDIRGELHDVFDSIKIKGNPEFETQLKQIWDTWAKVEQATSN